LLSKTSHFDLHQRPSPEEAGTQSVQVLRTGRTEYQLLLMKACDIGRNVKFLVIILVVFDEFY